MKQDDVGVRQLENGNWEYRYILKVDGETIMGRKRKDENGEPFKTKKAAVRARSLAIEKATLEVQAKHTAPPPLSAPPQKRTVAEVYQEYCEKGRSGKAYNTIKKQDSLWKNHLRAKFGHRYIDEISVAEIMDYLTDLYYVEHRAYKYVESFLKMFYLIFGQAYSRNYLDVDTYSKLCLNKGTKITMPKMKVDEDDDIIIFGGEELEKLDEYFSDTNGETAYLLGRYPDYTGVSRRIWSYRKTEQKNSAGLLSCAKGNGGKLADSHRIPSVSIKSATFTPKTCANPNNSRSVTVRE